MAAVEHEQLSFSDRLAELADRLQREHEATLYPRMILIEWVGGTVAEVEAVDAAGERQWRRLEARLADARVYRKLPDPDDDHGNLVNTLGEMGLLPCR